MKQLILKNDHVYFDKNILDTINEDNVPQTVVDDSNCKLNDRFRYDFVFSR